MTYQIDPATDMVLQLSFAPVREGEVQTQLVAQTNAGPIVLTLVGTGVR